MLRGLGCLGAHGPGMHVRMPHFPEGGIRCTCICHTLDRPPAPACCSQLEFADLAQLTYLNCVLKESMRLHPVASTGTVRRVCGGRRQRWKRSGLV